MKTDVQVKLYATLKRFQPECPDRYVIDAGITVGDLMAALQMPLREVNLIMVDGGRANLKTRLRGGESIALFPPLGGG